MIKAEEISARVGNTFYERDQKKLKGASMLVYIDARTCDRELDEIFGGLWKFEWTATKGWGVKGRLEVFNKELKEWLFREDVGYPQDTKMSKAKVEDEWLKDAVSDARKRCAVQFGVGSFLYEAPFFYLEAGMFDLKKGNDGKEYIKRITDEGQRMITARIKEWMEKLNAQKKKEGQNGTK